jgi:hypothetical protein
VSRRGRLGFVAACLLVFAMLATFIAWSTRPTGPSGKPSVTVTLAPGATQPAGLAVVDLGSVEQLQVRFNADKGMPRLVLALAPT